METVNTMFKCQLSRKLTKYCFALMMAMSMLISLPVHAQKEDALLKSAFVFNFAKFTNWPEYTWDFDDSTFFICSVGTDDVSQVLGQLNGESLNKRIVQVLNYQETTQTDACNLIYFADDASVEVDAILKSRCCESVLTVSVIEGFTSRGGMIEMYSDTNGKVRFKINLNKVITSGLNISSRLLSLAEIVTEEKQP